MKYLAAAVLLALPGLAAATPVLGPMVPSESVCATIADGTPETLVPYRRTSCDVSTGTAPETDEAPVVLAAMRSGR
jgi:hypothetical protein